MKEKLYKLFLWITGATIAFAAVSIEVTQPWLYSYSTYEFDTPSGGIEEGQWGKTDTGQVFMNATGTLVELDRRPKDRALDEILFIGQKHVDVFTDKEVRVTALEYKKLEKKERMPKRTTTVLTPIAEAAIGLEASNQVDSTGYQNSLTLSIDCTETDRGVLAFVANRKVTTEVSSVTHNGNSMAMEIEAENTNVAGVQMWSIPAADSGTNNVVYTYANYILSSVYNQCLSGTDQSDIVEATHSPSNGYSSSVTDSVTTITDGAWVFSGLNIQSNYTLTPDSGETELNDTDHSDSNLGRFGVSYIEKVTAGSETMGWSWSSSDNYTMILGVVKPSVAAGGGDIILIDGGFIIFE